MYRIWQRHRILVLSALAALAITAQPGGAAEPVKFPCGVGMVQGGHILRVDSRPAAVPSGHVRITFVGHSTFLIETPGGANAATDYSGFGAAGVTPQIVTMNNSHSSHYTDFLDPNIKFVLRGWDPKGGIARHDLKHRDLRVYNLPTNITRYDDRATNGNSVFVFEASGLCLAHLGHLHHFLSKEQVSRLGRIDVLFVPIDGAYTMSHAEALHIIGQVQPRVIIPMHFGFNGAAEFQAALNNRYNTSEPMKSPS